MSEKQTTTSNLSLHSIDLKHCKPNASSETVNIPIDENQSSAVPQQCSCGCIFKFSCKIVLTIVSICMIVIGSMYVQQCPAGRYISVYLIVGGLVGILNPLVSQCVIQSNNGDQTVLRKAFAKNSSLALLIISCFMLCWFFFGTFWIYVIYEPNDSTSCDEAVYLFSFWLITSVYLIVAAIIIIAFTVWVVGICAISIDILRWCECGCFAHPCCDGFP